MLQASQEALFDVTAAPDEPSAPRCRMCARPAVWLPKLGTYGSYCHRNNCPNRDRICQSCGGPFRLGVDGAGTKYCSTECKRKGYTGATRAEPVRCAWCNDPSPAGGRVRNKGIWPYICRECIEPIKHVVDRLKDHRVPHARARELLDDPGCEICGTDVIARRKESSTGKFSAWLVVDHDHACCPATARSCGACVRGLLCRHCNIALGMMGDDAARLMSAASYLQNSR